jgi:CBS domain-containing protein
MPTVRDVMTSDPLTIRASEAVTQAASLMRDNGIGALIVMQNDELLGIVTDRDITIRIVAEGHDPSTTQISQAASTDLETLSPDADAKEAAQRMSDRAIRRLPVVENGRPVGILSLGDLAIEMDAEKALTDISSAPTNN